MKKNIVAMLLTAAMVSLAAPFAYADTAPAAEDYVVMDVSSAANAAMYLEQECDWETLHAADSDYLLYYGNEERHIAISKSDLSAMLTDGMLYDGTGVPFSMPLERAIGIRSGAEVSKTLAVDEGVYRDVYFLACVSDKDGSASERFQVRLAYTDGSVQTVTGFSLFNSYPLDTAAEPSGALVAAPGAYRCLSTSLSFVKKGNIGLYSYPVAADSGKVLCSVSFFNDTASDIKILAVTGKLAEKTEIRAKLESYFLHPGTDKRWFANVESMIAQYERMGGLVSSIPGYSDYMAAHDRFYYTAADLSAVANGRFYMDDPQNTSYSAANDWDYIAGADNLPKYRAVSKSAMAALCENGIVRSSDGTPYGISDPPASAIAIEGAAQPSVRVPLHCEGYTRVHFLATAGDIAGNRLAHITIYYTDQSYETVELEVESGISLNGEVANADSANFAFSVDAYPPDLAHDCFDMQTYPQSIFTYSIATDPLKYVDAIVFAGAAADTSYRVLAVSGERALRGETVFYVDAAGKDEADGTYENPLSLSAAKARAAGIPDTDVRIVLKNGTYVLHEPLVFSAKDTCGHSRKITYVGEEKGKVYLSGSVPLSYTDFSLVTEEATLAKLPERARGKVVCLPLAKIGISGSEDVRFSRDTVTKVLYTNLFVNGNKEPIAQWPNGENQYARYTGVTEGGNNRPTFISDEDRIKNWSSRNGAYVGGYFGSDWYLDYSKIADIHPETGEITMDDDLLYGLDTSTAHSCRWKAFNLIEELDTPGEWYLDRAEQILYYYPCADFSLSDTIALSVNADALLSFDNTDDTMVFQNIVFENTIGRAIWGGANNLTITDCIFRNIGDDAVRLYGKHNTVSKNGLFHVGGFGIYISHSEIPDTVSNTIIGNYISDCRTGICFSAAGLRVENNTVHNMPQSALVGFMDTYATSIRYNEFYNCLREFSDAGVIYFGKRYSDPGNEIAYNYIYDFHPAVPFVSEKIYSIGIYLDDLYSGMDVHHNVIFDGRMSGIQIGGGIHNRVTNNLIAKMGGSNILTDHRGEDWIKPDTINALKAEAQSRMQNPWFAETYPQMQDCIDHAGEPYRNVIQDNVSDAPFKIDSRMESLGTVSGNSVLSDGWSENSVSADNVGADAEVIEWVHTLMGPFRKKYPLQGEHVDKNDLVLKWEPSFYADEYRVTLAYDRAMTDVIETWTVPYPFLDVSGILPDETMTYYWNVEAVNSSLKYRGNLPCTSGVTGFTIGERLESPFDLEVNLDENGDGTVTCNVRFTNRQSVAEAYTCYIAGYEDEGGTALCFADMEKGTARYGEPVSLRRTYTLPDNGSIKVFVWDADCRPLCTAYSTR